MATGGPKYDDRYLAGIVLFNRHDFFEAHELWEGLWLDRPGPDKRFYQGLIQAAVGLLHFGNGNLRGALKLYRSSRAYMEKYEPQHLGLDNAGFWRQMETCFAELLAAEPAHSLPLVKGEFGVELDLDRVPIIRLEPPPEAWPEPEEFLEGEE